MIVVRVGLNFFGNCEQEEIVGISFVLSTGDEMRLACRSAVSGGLEVGVYSVWFSGYRSTGLVTWY